MAGRIYEEARGKRATREAPPTSASCTRSRATWAGRGGSTIGLAPYKKDVDAISVDELVDHLSSAMDKERPHTGAASLSTTSTSVIPLYHPSLTFFSFSPSSSTSPLFQQSLDFVPTELHAPLWKVWDDANALW